MVRFLVPLYTLILLFITCPAAGSDSTWDYNSLSKKSTRQLMTDGCEAFEERLPARALSCFSVIIGRYDMDSDPDGLRDCIGALNNSGCVYKYFYYDYPEAYRNFSRAYELCETAGIDSILPVILVNLGDLLYDYNTIYKSPTMKQQADSLMNECVDYALEKKNWELFVNAFYCLANNNADINLDNYKAIFSKEIPQQTTSIDYVRLLYSGLKHVQSGNYAAARDDFNRQFGVINSRWQAPRDSISAYMNIARTYFLENDFTETAASLLDALQIAEAEKIDDIEAEIYRQLSDCYSRSGDTTLTQQYRIGYLEKLEQMHNSRLSNIAELKYLDDLKSESEKNHALAYRDHYNRMIIMIVIPVLIVVVIFALLLWRTNKKLNARVKSLYEKYHETLERDKTDSTDSDDRKYSHSNLNDSRREDLVNRIKAIFADPEIICEQGFTSAQLAEMVGSNTTYVSQVINETYHVSFSNLLGKCRVREACRRINDSRQFDNLTIEGIANSVGFKSRTALLNAFKREVGITPSEYIRMVAGERRDAKRVDAD